MKKTKLQKLKRKWKRTIKGLIVRIQWARKRRKYCYKGGMKHKFVASYATHQIPIESMKISGFFNTKELNDFLLRSTYILDTCEYCGKKIQHKRN